MNRLPTPETFLRDIAAHEMTVLRDDGLYRHVRFGKPDTGNLHFHLTTWPGYLAFSGDMGCYTFSRLPDMFEFFRGGLLNTGSFSIDLRYWAEKVQAEDRCDGIREYSPENFEEAVNDYLKDAEPSRAVRAAVKRDVLSRAHDGEHEAMRAAIDFEHDGFQFVDFWEYNVKEYSYRFIWCCYALAWAVRKYDGRDFAKETATCATTS